jgi:hypothetical protein
MAWRCRFLAARRGQHGRVIGAPDTLVDFHTAMDSSSKYKMTKSPLRMGPSWGLRKIPLLYTGTTSPSLYGFGPCFV